ncbi:unnamed protein product [Trichobilharzia regenti]|nr:unnamed protein product [Trichobilharzia regenti]
MNKAKEFYILTSKHVIQLPKFIQLCESIKKSSECITSNLVSCRWNSETSTCETKTKSSSSPSSSSSSSSSLDYDVITSISTGVHTVHRNTPEEKSFHYQDILSKFSTSNPNFCLFDKIKLEKNINGKRTAYWWKSLQGHMEQLQTSTSQENGLYSDTHLPILCVMSTRSNIMNQYQNLSCHCQPCSDCGDDQLYRMKITNCQSLSKESWSLTKLYLTGLLLLGLGFFTFHPTMQEFCLFAVVGLTTDFFLQLFFFVTILSVDIRRMEVSLLKVN